MCYTEVSDILCRTPHCNNIVAFAAPVDYVECQIVIDNGKPFGWCGRKDREWHPVTLRSEKQICLHCREEAVRRQNRLYQDLAQRVAESRATQQRNDDNRRAREQGLRYAGDRSGTPSAEQASLVSGAGMEWILGGQGIYSQEVSEMFGFLDEIPQEIELDADETAGGGSNDPGEGSSRGYDERYGHGGGQGQNQRSGRY